MVECEDILGVASSAYAAATRDEEAFWATLMAADRDLPETGSTRPVGEHFDFNDDEQMHARLPRLAAIYRPVQDSD